MNQSNPKANLTLAFKLLRKKGYFARQNFWCCQSCAWSAIPEGKNSKVVFYHNQDNAQLKEDGQCYLSYDGDVKEIMDTLKENGVNVLNENDVLTQGNRILIEI